MTWDIVLEDENRLSISTMNIEVSLDLLDNKQFTLIKYIDPFGDTFFNRLQMNDLIDDLERLKAMSANENLDEIITLASICRSETHLYLAFYGD